MAETSFDAVAGSLNSKIPSVLLAYYDSALPVNEKMTFNDLSSYKVVIIYFYATVPNGRRTFSVALPKGWIDANKGTTTNYFNASLYYNTAYNCSIGFTIDSNTQLTIRETSIVGYTEIRGICMYGIR